MSTIPGLEKVLGEFVELQVNTLKPTTLAAIIDDLLEEYDHTAEISRPNQETIDILATALVDAAGPGFAAVLLSGRIK